MKSEQQWIEDDLGIPLHSHLRPSSRKTLELLPTTQLKQIVAHGEREKSRTRSDHIRAPIAFPLLYSAQMLLKLG